MYSLLSVGLENYRLFLGRHVVPFTQGLTVVFGENRDETGSQSNGAGKSSLQEAILWCLTGETPRGVSEDHMIFDGGGEAAAKARVDVLLGGPGGRLLISRSRKRGSSSEVSVFREEHEGLWVDVLWEGARSIAKKEVMLEPLGALPVPGKKSQDVYMAWLGVPVETFMFAIYCRQGEADHIFRLPPKDRMSAFASLLGFGVWDDLLDKAKQQRETAALEVSEVRGKILSLSEQMEHWKLEADGEDDAKRVLEQINVRMQDMEVRAKNVEELLRKIEDTLWGNGEIEATRRRLESQMGELRRELDGIALDGAEREKQLDAIYAVTGVRDVAESQKWLSGELGTMRERLAEIDEILSIDRANKDAARFNAEVERQRTEVAGRLEALKVQRMEVIAKIEELRLALESNAAQCGPPEKLEDARKSHTDATMELARRQMVIDGWISRAKELLLACQMPGHALNVSDGELALSGGMTTGVLRCPTCKQEWADADKEWERIREGYRGAYYEWQVYREVVAQAETQRSALEKLHERLEQSRRAVKDATDQLAHIDDMGRDAIHTRDRIPALRDIIPIGSIDAVLSEKIQLDDRVGALQRMDTDLRMLSAAGDRIMREQERLHRIMQNVEGELSRVPKPVEVDLGEKTRLLMEKQALSDERQKAENERELALTVLLRIRAGRDTLSKIEAEKMALENAESTRRQLVDLRILEWLVGDGRARKVGALQRCKSWQIDSVLPRIEGRVNAFLATIGAIQKVKLQAGGDTLEILVEDSGTTRPWNLYSGGNKKRIILGFLEAIGTDKFGWHMYDEIFADVDQQGLRILMSTLKDSPGQKILITHRPEAQQYADNVITVVREGGKAFVR